MNFNDNPEELKKEEQAVLDKLISQMNCALQSLDNQMKNYVLEARNADISLNPDLYLSQVLAQRGIKDTEENREKMFQARDELYRVRLLLQYEDLEGSGIEEVKIGLHSYSQNGKQLITSWTMPLCRHYMLDKASTEFESIVLGRNREEYHTHYKLLVKNLVTLRFTRVVKGLNLFPGVFDDKTLKIMKGKGFMSDAYLDKMIKSFNPDEYNPDAVAEIISDEFLQELLERRTTSEFKNIVFSIQKKQGQIIQAPYKRNMVVQGCAGSGKSMIMLHRLPILLYDNPNSLSRTNLYIITPSPMYIQLVENMRYQLEISDIKMGTIEQYYDYCIDKYAGHKEGEYGEIDYEFQISSKDEQYIYSQKCIDDITAYFNALSKNKEPLDEAYALLFIKENEGHKTDTYEQKINNRLLKLQKVININNEVLVKYFKGIREVLNSLHNLSFTLCYRKDEIERVIKKGISENEEKIEKLQKELKELNSEKNKIAVENRKNIIKAAQNKIEQLRSQQVIVENDNDYFASLLELNKKIESVKKPFAAIRNEYSKNTVKSIYRSIDMIDQLIEECFILGQKISKTDDKYRNYIDPINKDVKQIEENVDILKRITEKYLKCDYYKKILEERNNLSDKSSNAIKTAYSRIMEKIGVKPSKDGDIKAIKYSPYIYLQVLYCYQGAPALKESLLAIDEAQGIAPEEIRLLKNINGNNVVFNMYGDINQHIEDSKGINDWDEYKYVLDFDFYEMNENYRNASQITEYCNRYFGMNMNPINTPGKGVHELGTESKFYAEMITQLMDTQRGGLSAILVSNNSEARKLMDTFSRYKQKFHDMTEEDFSIHRTRWNIINIKDAKGLEFSSVIVLSGRMSRNEKYIAFTRALDDLYIYPNLLDVTGFEKKAKKNNDKNSYKQETDKKKSSSDDIEAINKKSQGDYTNSKVKKFFEDNGMEVVDNRKQGGRLWVIGEKIAIKDIVDIAINKFKISGKYTIGKEIKNKSGWYTKTNK